MSQRYRRKFETQNKKFDMLKERAIDRLDLYLSHKGLSDNKASKILGIANSTLAKSREEGRDLSRRNIERSEEVFEDISGVWLRTGKGSMLRTPEATEELVQVTEDKGRPYYDVDFMGGYGEFLDDPSSTRVSYMINYPPYNKEGVFYMNVRGDSMAPELVSGEKIALRLVEDWQSFLFFGKIYGIVTRNGLRTIKRLRKGKDDDHYLLQATNPDYDDQEIPIAQIERVFEVLGSIREYE